MSRQISDTLRTNGFAWDDYSGAVGAWVRREPDGTLTKLGRVGRTYWAVVMTDETQAPVVYREVQNAKTRADALRALYEPAAVTLADQLYRRHRV